MNLPNDNEIMDKQAEKKPKKEVFQFAYKLPPMRVMMVLYMLFGTVMVLFYYFPQLFALLFSGYTNPADIVFLTQILGFTSLVLLLFLLWVFQYREAWFPFMRASMGGKTILFAWTKNRQMKFVTPKEQTWNTTEVDDISALEPDPDATYNGPCRTRVALFIPEWAKTINIRTIMEGKDLNMDITAYKQYAEFYANKMLAKNRSAWANIGPMMLPIIVLITLLVALYPTFEKRMSQQNDIENAQNMVYQCNSKLVANGLTPVDITPKSAVTTTTLNPNTQQPSQPSTGVSK